jgi:DNA-binding transcriptional LysR family regulator
MRSTAHSPLTLQRLRLLVALADEGSVTAAARSSGISQPALSQNLRVVERHVGYPLLMRVGRRVVLTRPARELVERARRILRLIAETERASRDLLEVRAGSLAIGAGATAGTYLLPRLLGEFRSHHRDVEIVLRIGEAPRVERWLLEGDLDLGVVGETTAPLAAPLAPFRRDELVVVASAAHPLATVPRLDAAALAAHPLIVRERESSTRQTLERVLGHSGHALSMLFELGSTEAILQAVAAGLGAAVVSELAVADPMLGRRLRVRRVAGLDLSRYLAVMTPPDGELGPAAKAFLALLTRGATPPSVPAA